MKIADAHPMPDSLFFVTNVDKMSVIAVKVKADSTAEVSLKQEDFPAEMKASTFYTMVAQTDRKGSSSSNSVRFGFLSDKPAAFFIEPGADTTISMNDVIHVNLEVIPNNDDPTNDKYTLTWNCGGAVSCIDANTTSGDLTWKTKGTHLVIVDITNDDGKKSSDTISVNVVSDPPKITATTDSKPRQKIKSTVEVNVSASDKHGTINKISWGCSAQKSGLDKAVADNKITIDPPTKSHSETVTVTLPGEETSYYCAFEATDDDEETARDTLTFEVVADKPYVHLNIKQQTLTINDQADLLFMAGDSLGSIVKYEKSCANKKDYLDENWETFTGSTRVFMPSTAGDGHQHRHHQGHGEPRCRRQGLDAVQRRVPAGKHQEVRMGLRYERFVHRLYVHFQQFARIQGRNARHPVRHIPLYCTGDRRRRQYRPRHSQDYRPSGPAHRYGTARNHHGARRLQHTARRHRLGWLRQHREA